MFAPRTGAQDLTAAEDKGIGRTEAGIDGLLFGVGEGADKDGASHTRHDTTFPTMLLETALETSVFDHVRTAKPTGQVFTSVVRLT